MNRLFLSAFLSAFFILPLSAQSSNTDSIKAEMNKIELTNPAFKQMIDRYKKGVIKGDAESMNDLGMECMSGKNVKTNLEMGLNLLDQAAKMDNVKAQYNLGNYFFIFWLQKPANDGYFSSGTKWLKKAVRGGDNNATTMLARFYYEYGKYKKDPTYVGSSIKLLESYPKVAEVNNKDENVLNAQAWLGTINLGKWRMDNDTIALRDAKKWYRILLKSNLEFPNYSNYIDSLQAILSMGVPIRIDPMPTPQEIEESKNSAGGFPGMGGGFPPMGGAPGMGGAPQGAQGARRPQATFPGGNMQKQQFIRANTNYLDDLKNNKISGRSTVSFTIDVDGAIINPVVTGNAEVYVMDKEALRTIMVMPDWIPAVSEDGTPVQANHTESVSFGSSGGMGGMGGFGF